MLAGPLGAGTEHSPDVVRICGELDVLCRLGRRDVCITVKDIAWVVPSFNQGQPVVFRRTVGGSHAVAVLFCEEVEVAAWSNLLGRDHQGRSGVRRRLGLHHRNLRNRVEPHYDRPGEVRRCLEETGRRIMESCDRHFQLRSTGCPDREVALGRGSATHQPGSQPRFVDFVRVEVQGACGTPIDKELSMPRPCATPGGDPLRGPAPDTSPSRCATGFRCCGSSASTPSKRLLSLPRAMSERRLWRTGSICVRAGAGPD